MSGAQASTRSVTPLPVRTDQWGMELEDLHNTFLEFMKVERSISDFTLRGYSYDFSRFVTYLREQADPVELQSFTAEMIRDYKLALSRNVTNRGGHRRGLSPITIKRHLASLSSFAEWLVMSKHLQVNPVRKLICPNCQRREADLRAESARATEGDDGRLPVRGRG